MYIYNKKEFINRLSHIVFASAFLLSLALVFPYDNNFSEILKSQGKLYKYKLETIPGSSNSFANAISAIFGDEAIINSNNARSIPVLLYHGIVNTPDRFSMTEGVFKDQMFALKKAGYKTIKLQDFYDFVNKGKPLPDKSFLLTFDDGRRDSYVMADPILKALDYSAVMYIATGDSVTPEKINSYYINKQDIRKMIDSGNWEIGSHAIQYDGGFILIDKNGTSGNFLSNRMWISDKNRLENNGEYEQRIGNELSESKDVLEDTFGVKVISISYPFGDYGQQQVNNINAKGYISKLVKKNYSLAFQQIWPVDDNFSFNYPFSDRYHLRRIESGTDWSGEHLLEFLDAGRVKDLPYSDDFSADLNWKKTWGNISVRDGELDIKSADDTRGAFTFLDGSYAWSDYFYTVDVNLGEDDVVSVIVRLKDNQNYAACLFNKSKIKIEQKIDGEVKVLETVKGPVDLPNKNISLSVLVLGSKINCYEGQTLVASSNDLSVDLKSGGVGFQIWNDEIGKASLSVSKINIIPAKDSENYLKSLAVYNEQGDTPISNIDLSVVIPPVKPINLVNPDGSANPYEFIASQNNNKNSDWKSILGKIEFNEDVMNINSSKDTTVSLVTIPGARDWTNYNFETQVELVKGSGVSLISRYKDPKNYVVCSYLSSGKLIRALLIKDGQQYLISEVNNPYSTILNYIIGKTNLGMSVSDNNIQCYYKNYLVLSTSTTTMPTSGGIGYKVYHKDIGEAFMKVYSAIIRRI